MNTVKVRVCGVRGCDGDYYSKGLCKPHYQKAYRDRVTAVQNAERGAARLSARAAIEKRVLEKMRKVGRRV
jgi:hypothetical protein